MKGVWNWIKSFSDDPQSKIAVLLCMLNLLSSCVLLSVYGDTNSLALLAYGSIGLFNLFSVVGAMVSRSLISRGPNPRFCFGYQRVEVLTLFSSACLTMLVPLFIIKECVERLFSPPLVHTGRLIVGVFVALASQLTLIFGASNPALNQVMSACTSSWLQEHIADISTSVCHVMPMLSPVLLPRANPLCLLSCCGAFATLITYSLINLNECMLADVIAAVIICSFTWATFTPIGYYSGKILLQSTPSHVVGQLDKCLRESLTFDGVLEFCNERFWTLGFGTLAGSLHVRIRRDANEQVVLAHIHERLSPLVTHLTIQVFKDEWTRSHTTIQLLSDTAMALNLPSGIGALPPPPLKYATMPTPGPSSPPLMSTSKFIPSKKHSISDDDFAYTIGPPRAATSASNGGLSVPPVNPVSASPTPPRNTMVTNNNNKVEYWNLETKPKTDYGSSQNTPQLPPVGGRDISLYNASTLVPKRYYPPGSSFSPERKNPFLSGQENGNVSPR